MFSGVVTNRFTSGNHDPKCKSVFCLLYLCYIQILVITNFINIKWLVITRLVLPTPIKIQRVKLFKMLPFSYLELSSVARRS